MDIEFQINLFRYFLQIRDSRKFIHDLDNHLFDLDEHKFMFSAVQMYVKKYKYQPDKVNLRQFIKEILKKNPVQDDMKKIIDELVEEIYEPLETDTVIYKKTITEFIQRKQTKKLFDQFGDEISYGDSEFFKKMKNRMLDISKIGSDEELSEGEPGQFLIKNFNGFVKRDKNHATPTFLRMLNKLTADRGFFSPQLIVFMGGPKSFKTGLSLNFARDFMASGLKVFYADFENGVDSIRNRLYQSMIQVTKLELRSGEYDEELKHMVAQYAKAGGDIRIERFYANVSTLDDVENKLDELEENDGWIPDVIVYDYIDLAEAADRSITETRKKIQYNYHHAIRINSKRGCFSINISQVKQTAVDKEVITIKDFSEDFGKAMNCHAAFAICRTEEEIENGTGRIVVVAQREGEKPSPNRYCPIRIHEDIQHVKEIEEYEEYFNRYSKRKEDDE